LKDQVLSVEIERKQNENNLQLINELKGKNSDLVKKLQENEHQMDELNKSIESHKEQTKLLSKETDQIIDVRKKLTKLETANSSFEKSISELTAEKK